MLGLPQGAAETGPSDRAVVAAVQGSAGPRTIPAIQLQRAIGLRSSKWQTRIELGEAPPPPPDPEARRRAREAVPGELRTLERELSELRADDAEVTGDVEQAAMEWTRERQDAETQLQTYRDRARELKARLRQIESAGGDTPCPTCGRPLTGQFEDVVATLRDEWEGVVQDGRWWKRRREQLEEKPERLRELEGRALRIHAALEACSERVERARARLEGLGPRPPRPDGVDSTATRPAGAPAATGPAVRDRSAGGPAPGDPSAEASPTGRALARLREERLSAARLRALLRASRVVEQVTGGRVLFLSMDAGGALVPQGARGPLDDPAGEEDAAVRLALCAVAASARPDATLLLPEGTLEALAATDALRAVDILRVLLRSVPRVLVVTDGRVVDRRPEAFDHAVELESEGEGAWARPLAVGTGVVIPAR
ncbi:MAG: hypothetical protein KY453_04600 [Gemmatimonadetes bacterium]|nr:hypothetical protein [Gemmatimonadota bacterium]